MKYMNTKWNKFVTGIITNIGWLIVLGLSLLTILVTQLGTTHRNEPAELATLDGLIEVYEEFGKIKWVGMVHPDPEPDDEMKITVKKYFENEIVAINIRIEEATDPDIIDSLMYDKNILMYRQKLVKDGVFKNFSDGSMVVPNRVYDIKFNWAAEYRMDKIIKAATTDVFSWVLVVLLAFSAILIKIQGNKTGKMSGFKIVWGTTARHATLSEKIAPKSAEAELICIRMNEDELKAQRIKRLQRESLNYEDVFDERGTFLLNPNFIEVDITSYKKKGKTYYRENPYHKKLQKKQRKAVDKLKGFNIKEVHTFILLETKAEAKERFDYGESLKTRDRRATTTNVITSLLTALPMFTVASVLVVTQDKAGLLLGAAGILLNVVSLFFNIFGSYDYIINTWTPNVIKKCDTLLAIAIELGVADDIDKNWDERLEKEMHNDNKK